MPVDFLTDEQAQRYGRYAGDPTPLQLARYFYLDDDDRSLVAIRRGEHNRLGFALQLCTVRFLGTFLSDPTDAPASVVKHLAAQLAISDPFCLSQYRQRPATHREHAGEIQRRLGYRDFSDKAENFRLIRWLYTRAWLSAERPIVLFDLATARLVERKVLLPGVTVLTRLIARVRDRAANRLYRSIARLPSQEQRARLETLLIVPAGAHVSPLDRLRRAPTRISAPAMVDALGRLAEIRDFEASTLPLDRIPPGRVKVLARCAAAAWAQTVARMPDDRRIATLVAFAYVFESVAQDDCVDLLNQMITASLARAEREGEKDRLHTIGDLDAAALRLHEVCKIILDPACADSKVREQIFARIPREQLERDVARVAALSRTEDDHYYDHLLGNYSTVRRFLPLLYKTIEFSGAKAAQGVLQALQFLKQIEGQAKPAMETAPQEVLNRAWRKLVIRADGKIDRRFYTFCVLEQLQQGLDRRDIFVTPSERWGDPRAKLLQGQAWEAARSHVCRTLNLSAMAEPELTKLAGLLDETYRRVAANLVTNTAVEIEHSDGKDRLSLGRLDKLDEPPSLTAGYQFSPRLADIGESRFWRISPEADYGRLNGLARQRVKTILIGENWDDMLRVAGSLKMGTVSASEIIRSLQRGAKRPLLGRAIGELGRIPKTLHLLTFIDDEAYRRRILTQLNRGEGRNGLARVVFHGRRGEVRQRYREGQEDQLGALGLVVNALVLWNTRYMDAAVAHLKAAGMEIKKDDLERLSPLGNKHFNVLGRYHFSTTDAVLRGELRPLRDPEDRTEYGLMSA